MTSNDARLHAQGTLDEHWDAEAHLTVTDLNRWDLDLDGSGSMDLTLQGPRSTPRLQGQSSLDTIRVGDYTVEEVRLELQVDSDRDRPSAVDLQAHNIQAGERTLQKLTVEGDGPIAEHGLHVTTVHQENRLQFSLNGGLSNGRWAGHLKDLQIQSSDFGRWDQQSPSRLVLSRETGSLEETCLTANQSTLCASLKGGTNGWTGALRAVEVPMSRFNPLLRNNIRMDGTINLKVSGQYSGPRSAELDGTLSLERGSLEYTPDETSDSEVIPLRSTSLTLSLSKNQLSTQLSSDFSEYGQIHGQIQIDTPLPVGSLPDRHFEGTLSGTAAKLSLLHLATDAAQWQSGAVKLDVSGSGPLNNPRLHGSARLETGQVRLVDPGITVKNMNGELRADGSSLNYSVSGESGGGTLAIRGSASRSQTRSWKTTLQITGRDFRTVRTEKIELNTSPDLELSLDYPRVVLRGRVKLPLLHLRELTALSQDAVTTSEDVRYTHEPEPETTQPLSMKTWNVDGLVTIVLGEDIRIQEGGFEGGLAGSITLTEKPNQPTLARGELEILGGSYRAYGRSLSIRSGRIIFSQTAPENPRLEIEAVRTFRDVVAGVRVRGTAEDPELTLFSEPPMQETDILSYIVLGKPATGATGDRRQILLQAATAAGFKGGNQLISTLEERLGLETLQLETEGSLEEGSLAIGKYLSPRLYVSYGVGLFDNQDQIKFRYEFDEHWTLEALGGEHTSADLFYRFRP
jgi:translocation and assembly module TamB